MTPTFTDEQCLAMDLITSIVHGKATDCLIQGSPGTGKTFCVTHALKSLGVPLHRLAIATPTHRAKGVIKDYLASINLDVECFTIHSLLGLGMAIDEDSGKQRFDSGANSVPITRFDYVWIDECSMIDSALFKKLIGYPVKLLFTGDKRQLLPVGENSFPVFDHFNNSNLKAELTQPQRYSGAIKDLVYACIPHIDAETVFSPSMYLLDESCHQSINWFEDWKSSEFESKVALTFTNKDVDKLNLKCRQHIYDTRIPDQFYTDENVITYSVVNDIHGEKLISNGTELTIEAIEPSSIILGNDVFEALELWFYGVPHSCRVVSTRDTEKWNKALTAIQGQCKKKEKPWSFYYWAKGLSAEIKPVHAMTIHKSQGSGFEQVFLIDCFKYLKDGAIQPRLHYVGSSRAKKQLIYSGSI